MTVKLLVNSGAFQGRPSAGQPLAASASLANMLTGSQYGRMVEYGMMEKKMETTIVLYRV